MNYNRALLGGHLTRDPELRYTGSGTAICEFGIAVNREFEVNGERRSEVTFVECKAWRRRGEVIAEHFSKGKPIFVEGHLTYEEWTDGPTQQKRSKLKVTVDNFQFVGPKGESRVWKGSDQSGAGGATREVSSAGRAQGSSRPGEVDDRDIPF